MAVSPRRVMLAHAFMLEMLDALVRDGLATAERREMRAGRQPIQVTWVDDHRRRAVGTRRMMHCRSGGTKSGGGGFGCAGCRGSSCGSGHGAGCGVER
jgi:hypothetical protein